MRERIKAELSEVLQKNILLPAMVAEFEVGFEDMVTLNKAYAIMLAEEKIIDQKTAGRLLQGLKKVHKELTVSELSGKYEELYFNFEHAFFEIVGREIGGRLHTGRSRNDIYATLARMEIRKSLWEVCKKKSRIAGVASRASAGSPGDCDYRLYPHSTRSTNNIWPLLHGSSSSSGTRL